ncbi:MAG: copper resistance protein NlpE N-terminal domain-containing protein [Saprospiraceae bacterium]|nr:copper resistance protein NlpE N-terminal domain-containing protein [Saprospiraceae bacterium]
MKITLSLILFSLSLFMISCSASKKSVTEESPKTNASKSKAPLDWTGTYTGNLPCADCVGISTMIRLNKDMSYIMESNYMGKSGDIQRQRGTIAWNAADSTLSFSPIAGKPNAFKYWASENRITQLDDNGKKIKGDLAANYILTKDAGGITEKYWKLIEVNGEKSAMSDKPNKEAHMVLKALGNKVLGNGTCNIFSAAFEFLAGNGIRISSLASTKMRCDIPEQESAFFKALESADNYSLDGKMLLLKQGKVNTLARFEFVEMK